MPKGTRDYELQDQGIQKARKTVDCLASETLESKALERTRKFLLAESNG